ncbi:putative exostosin [Helianthus annuus]|nr:putative exostosin [Helianthus annuus]
MSPGDISPVEYRTILKYRLMIPLFPVDEVCTVCHKACLDSFREHAIHCRELPGFKYRHDLVRDVLVDIFRCAGVSPLVGLGGSAFTVGQAASGKVTKHEKACIDNQHVFIPFAFDTFGFLAPEAVDLLSRVQRVMHSNVTTPRSMDVVFKRLSFAIKKGVAAQFVVRLPTISM